MLIYETDIASSYEAVDAIIPTLLEAIKSKFMFMSDRYMFNINFMLREILNNAVEHGNHFDPEKRVYCRIDYKVPVLAFIIKDEGEGINLENIPTEAHHPRELLRVRNRGHQTIRDMDFDIRINGTEVKILLNLNQGERLWKNNY